MGIRITEKKRIDIENSCVANPIYLNWMGTHGGERNYWLFGVTQTLSLTPSVVSTFSPYVEDNTNATTYLAEISRGAYESMTMGANVPVDKVKGIATLLRSPNVLVLINPDTWETEGPKWVQVFPEPGTFRVLETSETRSEISFTIRFNEINIQSY